MAITLRCYVPPKDIAEFIADAVSMSRTYMEGVERGEQNISIQNLIQISFALEVEVGILLPSAWITSLSYSLGAQL